MLTTEIDSAPLEVVVSEAWRIGQRIDLAGVGYGRIHWGDGKAVVERPYPYYYFLAGFVRVISARRLIEIGTHQGGSTKALCAGLALREGARIITFDVTADGASIFQGHEVIEAYTLDGNSPEAYEVTQEMRVPGAGPDLVYIDALHLYEPTLESFQRYGEDYGARFVILDDITLNDSMQRFWIDVVNRYGEDAIDASTIEPIRNSGPTNPGFGVVRIRRTNV